MTEERPPSAPKASQLWKAVQNNVQYVGCFADFPATNPRRYGDQKYFQDQNGTRRVAPAPSPDDRLPPARKTYTRWQDGPLRLMRSLEDGRDEEDPRQLPRHACLWRCYQKAKKSGHQYFALQNGGWCFGSNDQRFARVGPRPDRDCRVCAQECRPGEQPCGVEIQPAGTECTSDQHRACAVGEGRPAQEKGTHTGGYFTNSVWKIKNLDYGTYAEPDTTTRPFRLAQETQRHWAPYLFSAPDLSGQAGMTAGCPRFPDNLFPLTPAQLFGAHYFTPDHVLKLFLLWHGAGAGKTCEMLNIMVNFLARRWNVFWVTRKALRGVPLMDLYQNLCQTRLRDLVESQKPILRADGTVMADDRARKIAFIRSGKPGAAMVLKRYGANLDKQRIMTYGDMVDVLLGRGPKRHLLDLASRDPLRRTVFFIDEAHNLTSSEFARGPEASRLNENLPSFTFAGQEFRSRNDVYGPAAGAGSEHGLQGRDVLAAALYRSYALSGAESAKVVLATATPMLSSPQELMWLLNLGVDNPRERLNLRVRNRLEGASRFRFARAAVGRISYLQLSRDPTRFSRRVLAGIHTTRMHPWHYDLLQKRVKKAENAHEDVVQVYRDYGLLGQDSFTRAAPCVFPAQKVARPVRPDKENSGFTFTFYHARFSARKFRAAMSVYAPKLLALINNILKLEREAKSDRLPGRKHTVFTFSESGKNRRKHFGAKAVASAFLAFGDQFRLCLDYRKVRGKTTLCAPAEADGRYGVAMLTLNDVPAHAGCPKGVRFDSAVINATQAAFNADDNTFGARIKVLIIEKPFQEGISAYNVAESHFLQPGLSVEDLDQASARSCRVCRSQALPFYQGVGAFTNMHFYPVTTPDGRPLYQEMLDHVPPERLRSLNLIPEFRRMAQDVAVDASLNLRVNEFDPVFFGRVVKNCADRRRTYQIGLETPVRVPADTALTQFRHVQHTRTVWIDPDCMADSFTTGDQVVTHLDPEPRTISRIQGDRVSFRQKTREATLAELRFAPGQKVRFRLPSGVEMARKTLDIGRASEFTPQPEPASRLRVRIPEKWKRFVNLEFTSFRGQLRHVLLGLLAVLRMVKAGGHVRTPLRVVLPETAKDLPDVSVVWRCTERRRALEADASTWDSFLAPTRGLSVLLLMMRDPLCPDDSNSDALPGWHTNLLLYVPAWRTVERFDPLGANSLFFDTVALDKALTAELRHPRHPRVRYIHGAQSNLVRGVQDWQEREGRKHELDPNSFNTAFVLFYLHVRLMYASAHADQPPDNALLFPWRFQQGVMQSLLTQHSGRLTEYIRAYAEMMMYEKRIVRRFSGFNADKTWVENLLHMVQTLSADLGKKTWTRKAYDLWQGTDRQSRLPSPSVSLSLTSAGANPETKVAASAKKPVLVHRRHLGLW